MAPRSSPRGNGYALSRDLSPRLVPIASCKPLGRETRKHPPQQVGKLATSLERFGFVAPILIDSVGHVVAGWGLVQAARQLGHTEVPAICVTDLPEAELRALRLALNRITEDSAWTARRSSWSFRRSSNWRRNSIWKSPASRWARSTSFWTMMAPT